MGSLRSSVRVCTMGAIVLASCGGNDGPAANAGVVVRTDPATAAQCPGGGSVVSSGLDKNGNHALDSDEVTTTTVVCMTVLTRLVAEPPGAHCADGGTAVLSGPDRNGDGTLGADEVIHTDYVCGKPLLHSLAAEPAGAHCAEGGVAFSFGIDDNSNGTLDAAEVTDIEYACGNTLSRDVSISQAGELDALAPVIAINGSLTISGTSLLSVALPALQHVDGDLTISNNGRLATLDLPQLRAVAGSLTLAGDAVATIHAPLLHRLGGLAITGDGSLHDLAAFSALAEVTGDVQVTGNAALTAIDLPTARAGGKLVIQDDPALTTLHWVLAQRQRDVVIQNTGLERLELTTDFDFASGAVVEAVSVTGNTKLTTATLTLDQTGPLTIQGNAVLDSVTLDVSTVHGGVTVQTNPTQRFLTFQSQIRPNGQQVIEGSVNISAPLINLAFLPEIPPAIITGNLGIIGTQLTELSGPEIGGTLDVENNPALSAPLFVFTFDSLKVINNPKLVQLLSEPAFNRSLSSVTISGNAALTDITGLSTVRSIELGLTVTDNPKLTSGLSSGLVELGNLQVKNNAALTDLGLPSLQTVGPILAGTISIDTNPALISISLPALTSATEIDITANLLARHVAMPALTHATTVSVVGNPVLPTCEINQVFGHVGATTLTVRNNDDATMCP